MSVIHGSENSVGVKVTSEGQLHTYAVVEREQLHVNEHEKQAYSLVVSQTPTGAGDCFLYIKNTGDDDLIISSIKLYSASAERVQVKLGDSGTTSGGTALTPVNRNAGSNNAPTATIEDGVDITGLSGGSVMDDITAGTTMAKWSWESGIILSTNTVATFYAVTGAVAIRMTVSFYIHD
jgi:hypothetical protein